MSPNGSVRQIKSSHEISQHELKRRELSSRGLLVERSVEISVHKNGYTVDVDGVRVSIIVQIVDLIDVSVLHDYKVIR